MLLLNHFDEHLKKAKEIEKLLKLLTTAETYKLYPMFRIVVKKLKKAIDDENQLYRSLNSRKINILIDEVNAIINAKLDNENENMYNHILYKASFYNGNYLSYVWDKNVHWLAISKTEELKQKADFKTKACFTEIKNEILFFYPSILESVINQIIEKDKSIEIIGEGFQSYITPQFDEHFIKGYNWVYKKSHIEGLIKEYFKLTDIDYLYSPETRANLFFQQCLIESVVTFLTEENKQDLKERLQELNLLTPRENNQYVVGLLLAALEPVGLKKIIIRVVQ